MGLTMRKGQDVACFTVIEWFECEENFKDHLVQPFYHGRDIHQRTGLIKASSNLTLNPSNYDASITSLCNLFMCLANLTVKQFIMFN